MKICLTVHDPKEKNESLLKKLAKLGPRKRSKLEKKYLNSGVKKLIILALVENVKECNYNVAKLMDLINIGSIGFLLAADLKMQNSVVGLQGHSCTHNCIYCEGSKPWTEAGKPRTLRNIRQHAKNFAKSSKKLKIPKNFKNAIHLPLITGDEDEEILDLVPLAQLHLKLGVTNTLLFEANTKAGNNLVINWANGLHCYQEVRGSKPFNGER